MIILAYVALIALGGALAVRIGARAETGVLTVSAGVIVGFCAASFWSGLLPVAAWTVLGAGLASAAWLAWRALRHASSRPGGARLTWLAVLAALPPLFLWTSADFQLLNWDDMSHWARVTSYFVHEDRMYDAEVFSIAAKSYPPGSALFHYYFLETGGYTDPHVIFAHFVLVVAALAALLSPVAVRRSMVAGIALLVAFLGFYLFRFSFTEIGVDALLAVLFAAACIIALTERSPYVVAVAGPLLVAALTLVKTTGFAFALVASVAIIATTILRARQRPGAPFCWEPRLSRPALIAIICLPLVVGGVYSGWQSYAVHIHAAKPTLAQGQALRGLVSGLRADPMPPRFAQTLEEAERRLSSADPFHNHLFGVVGSWAVSPAALAAIMVGVSACLVALWRGARLPLAATLGLVGLGLAPYLALLLTAYLTWFTEYEGTRLASFERYLASYYYGWACVVLSAAALQLAERARPPVALAIAGVIGATASTTVPGFVARQRVIAAHQREHFLAAKQDAERLAETVRRETRADDPVYFVKQNDTGFEMYAFQFAVRQHRTQAFCWSLGKPYYEGDVWTCDASLEEKVQGYRVLALARGDAQFWERNGHLFAEKDRGTPSGVFRIDWESGRPRFRRIDPARRQPRSGAPG